ncbi:NPCBM/NEW2 domain-containing protein [Pelagicoccus sp. SDUM812005]|uniref:NPCBM/NEW2 domain-containing protein n=1 Tax=Pelagicoccus sp. SDUM812005 TaxID=3041257 RepID=UPI00280F196C|nr:NPCBM/NEW2 domain-containing protein [Pelagicoccus sp. SDUM812005]MDQ8181028.1 NPCBM/NEW2 domain-containing protein [Pelagicoccus sp. SDUM812005]
MRLYPLLALMAAATAPFLAASSKPEHWELAPTPPMGWNSWDIFGTSVTESQIREQADAMAEHLLPFGYDVLTVDIQWYEPNAKGHYYNPGAELSMDAFSRLTPAENRFPSAAGGKGFKPLADYVRSKGLRFGIHIMRGIPRQAVERDTPLLGTAATAGEVGIVDSVCPWNPDMYGVDATTEAGQAYYDSIFQLYAEWGVDYVKVDDISRPYDAVQRAEIEAIRAAIDKCGRPMVLSLSPGSTPVEAGEHVSQHANLWRITDDFWDRWGLLKAMFERCHAWTPYRRPGAWPDADMLPIGIVEFDRPTQFTEDEIYTLMTLWSIARSPLIFGGDMTRLDAFTKRMLTHPPMLEVNQNSENNRQVSRIRNHIVWMADVPGSEDKYVALFNAQSAGERLTFSEADYASPVIAGKGQSQEISLDIGAAKRLVLFVTDGGDGFDWDHAVWVDPTLHGPGGSLKLTELDWAYADAGWGAPRVNLSCAGEPLVLDGKRVEGIGTHSESKIVYELPEGYERFTAKGVVTEKGSVMFGVLAEESLVSLEIDTEVSVSFAELGLPERAQVRDLWAEEDLGIFQNEFTREIAPHGAGLYRITPLSER